MATDNIVNELIINKLTQAQFDAIPEAERSDTELYFITDGDTDTGGSNQINWTHVYDIPDDNEWYSYLYLSFKVDTLPDGNYEFYFYTTRYYSDRNLLVPTTWKVSFFVKTDGYRQVQGFISPIFNGDFSFLFESFSIYSQGIRYHHTSDGDILVPETFYACKANTSSTVKGIAKCTDIINVDTNQVYPTALILDSDVPFFDNQIGYIDLGVMVEYPTKQSSTEHNGFTFNNDGLCLYGIGKDPESFGDGYGCLGGVITVKSIADLGEFEAEVYVNEGGVTYKVIKASGILQNAELGTSSTQSANTWLKPNFEDGQSHECEFWYSRFGANDNTNFYWFNPGAEDVYVPYTKLNVGSTVTPLNYNKVIQYTQESTDEYTQGYFYKAVGDIINIPENVTLIKTLESDFEISLADDKDIISLLSSFVGWPIESTIENLKYSQFIYYYGAGNPYIWWNYGGDIYDQELLSCFNVIPESEAPEGYPQSVEFALRYTPASQKVENGMWEQVNVQPASEASSDYLPLSGGTLTGDLAFAKSKKIVLDNPTGDSYGDSYIMHRGSAKGIAIGYIYNDEFVDNFYFKTSRAVGIGFIPASAAGATLGNNSAKWTAAYVNKLNNGADLDIPTTGGTLARLEDIPEGTQLETLPIASADNLNKIYQYVGETTSDYTNGYFYKSTNDIVQDWFTTGYAQYDTSLTLIVTVDKEKFLAQNPVWQDMGAKTWRADYDESTGEWYVWTQQPNIYISNADLKDVWGIDVTNVAGDYVPANGDTLLVQLTESESFSWQQIYVQPTSGIEDSMGSANALVDTHDTSLDAHENIRGIANGLATLDSNAKVPMSQINDSLLGNVQYQGLYDVSTNTPNLDTVETKGHYYIVSAAGDRFDISFEVGDWIISDGTNWTKVDNTDAVSSVNGRTGNVVITTEDLDLSAYVQKTDYANSKTAGLIRGYNANGFGFVPDTGYPFCETKSLTSYNAAGGNLFVSKGTLETVKYSYVRDGIANNTYSLSDTEKEKVRNWIGASVPTAFETMPDIYASAGKTYQYVGETTEEFTNGYFYKSVSQGISYIPSDSNLTFDFDLFWSELESAGITLETLQMTELDKERGGFSIIGTVESETNYRVQDINGVQLDVLLTQSIQTTSEYVGANNRWYYKPAETFAWERVDVQPNTNTNIPAHPTTPGAYTLMCYVDENGSASYAWENVA